MTSTQIGDYLSSRTGTIPPHTVPGTNTLTLTLAQADHPVHIKSSKYIQSIASA